MERLAAIGGGILAILIGILMVKKGQHWFGSEANLGVGGKGLGLILAIFGVIAIAVGIIGG